MLRLKKKPDVQMEIDSTKPIAKQLEMEDTTSSVNTESELKGQSMDDQKNLNSNEVAAVSSGLKLIGGVGGVSVRNGTNHKPVGKKKTPGEIRIQKEISDLDGGSVANIEFPNPNDLTNFNVTIIPDGGFWAGAKYKFKFSISPNYPHDPPKVTCETKIYHPNIDLAGAVCLNILREEWKPVLDVNAVIFGLITLFYEPYANDPLNREAADLLRSDRKQFEKVVKRTLQGYPHAGENFDKLI